jgi:hypothetical protein
MHARVKSAATLGVLAVLCVIGLLLGVRAVTTDLPTGSLVKDPPPACEDRTIEKGGRIAAADVLVSVYNSGSRAGRASRTMNQLQERGFAAGESGNAPEGTNVSRAQVWYDDPTNPAALLVARQFGRNAKIYPRQPKLGIGVVVVVGDSFEKLARRAPLQLQANRRVKICSPPVEQQPVS